ncbi:hypothetical protein K474DRAFT_1705823 [Panus rudis PR-1116 ss-1]|nr:hypothetical protein K474DRAFT_1705823 [Panus rudis PR-1116 ss-1]
MVWLRDESSNRSIALATLVTAISAATLTHAAPPSFPSSGNGIWYRKQGSAWSKEWIPIGNGYLGAMTPGGTTKEFTQLNVETLWSGGPFEDPSYNGGNKQPSEQAAMAVDMRDIRQNIFTSPTGTIDNIEELGTDPGAYGSYVGAGYLVTTLDTNTTTSDYARWLDLDNGIAHASWSTGGDQFIRSSFCSVPAKACVQHLNSTAVIQNITYAFNTAVEAGLPTATVTCLDNSTLLLKNKASATGMAYELLGRVNAIGTSPAVACSPKGSSNATISVTGATQSWVTWVGDTEYSIDAGDAAHDFSFKHDLPHDALVATLNTASPISAGASEYAALLNDHVKSIQTVLGSFKLSLGQKPDLSKSTDELFDAYQVDSGDPYLEWLIFNFGRYLLAGSAPGVLPANLQGVWARDTSNPWSADYHANINLQMNYWFSEQTNMNVAQSLFNYMEKTWAPRGAYTAKVLYNITRGWVTHNEMNIFGHTGMKLSGNSAQWADYPESAVWMMIHVWDHFDYTNDVNWWKSQGWPLLKGVASFHLDKLVPDLRFNDSTLVVVPCNSPEQVPITLGCAHAQQLIWQLFNAVEKGFAASGDSDTAFLDEVRDKRSRMDKGIHIGSWGQLQEWKVDMDSPSDTHRHLSHLVGLYPGYAVSGYTPSLQNGPDKKRNYSKADVLAAAKTSLIHRGNGTGPDADAGWEKVWRAACWAQFQDADEFYHELTYAIVRDFGPSLLSLYNPGDPDPILQIDANFGFTAAVMNALLQASDVPSASTPMEMNVLPALPKSWSSGSIKGARVRGAMTVDLEWSGGKARSLTIRTDSNARPRPVRVINKGKTVSSFTSSPGSTKTIHF